MIKKKERKEKNLIVKELIDINWTKWYDVTIFNRRFGFSELQKIISTILRRYKLNIIPEFLFYQLNEFIDLGSLRALIHRCCSNFKVHFALISVTIFLCNWFFLNISLICVNIFNLIHFDHDCNLYKNKEKTKSFELFYNII